MRGALDCQQMGDVLFSNFSDRVLIIAPYNTLFLSVNDQFDGRTKKELCLGLVISFLYLDYAMKITKKYFWDARE